MTLDDRWHASAPPPAPPPAARHAGPRPLAELQQAAPSVDAYEAGLDDDARFAVASGPLPAPPTEAAPPNGPGPVGASRPGPRETLVIAHRGDALVHPENTLAAMTSALDKGAQGLEVDVCLTADGHLILWHDEAGSGLVPLVRSAGFEKGQNFRPINPPRRIHEMTLAEVRASCGYEDMRTGRRVPVEIPTLDALLSLVKADPRLQRLDLDVKVQPGATDVQRAYARALQRRLAEAGLGDRVQLLVDDPDTLLTLRGVMGPKHRWSSDRNVAPLVGVRPGELDGLVREAIRDGNGVVSLGRPVAGTLWGSWSDVVNLISGMFRGRAAAPGAFDAYLACLRSARAEIDASGRDVRLVAWTINDPDEMAELLAVPVDEILTDRPERLLAVKAQVDAGSYVYERPRDRPVANAISGLLDTLAWFPGAALTLLRRGLAAIGLAAAGHALESAGFGALEALLARPGRWLAERIDDLFVWLRGR